MNRENKPNFSKEILNRWQVKCMPCRFVESNLSRAQAQKKAQEHKAIKVVGYNHAVSIRDLGLFRN